MSEQQKCPEQEWFDALEKRGSMEPEKLAKLRVNHTCLFGVCTTQADSTEDAAAVIASENERFATDLRSRAARLSRRVNTRLRRAG